MKPKQPSYQRQIKVLKQSKRRQQIEQKLASMRFSQQLKQIVSQQSQYYETQFIIDEQSFTKILNDQNIDQIYKIIMNGDFQTLKMLQKYSQQLIQLLLSAINTPHGIISLTNLIKRSQFSALLLHRMKKLDLVLNNLKKYSINSHQQNIYLACICQIMKLKQKYLITVDQQSLIEQIEIIFKQRIQRQIEDNIVITIIKTLIESCNPNHIGQSFLSAIIEYFWTTKHMINVVNLYLTAIAAIQNKTYRKSITIIINLVQIIIRGRHRLDMDLKQKVKSVLQILTTLFTNFNSNWQDLIDHSGQIDIEGLHEFILKFQSQIFESAKIDQQYCLFLRQFCRHCEGGTIFKILNENGTLQYLIEEMTCSVSICHLILKTFFGLIFNNSNKQAQEMIISILKYSSIQKSLSLCLINFEDNQQLYNLANHLLSELVIRIK